MKSLVIYDSVYGNTEKIAQAIATTLGADIHKIGDARLEMLDGVELLVVGSPTQKFRPMPAVTGFLDRIPVGKLQGMKVAAFDTRVSQEALKRSPGILRLFVSIFGYAAEFIGKKLTKKGGVLVLAPEGFFVPESEGPLVEGELERASTWAKQLM